MQRLFERIAEEAEALRALGDELEARLAALREDARDELEEVEWRVHLFENELLRVREDLRAPALDVARSARTLACDVLRGCEVLRDSVDRRLERD